MLRFYEIVATAVAVDFFATRLALMVKLADIFARSPVAYIPTSIKTNVV
jgi:hypothetical protein